MPNILIGNHVLLATDLVGVTAAGYYRHAVRSQQHERHNANPCPLLQHVSVPSNLEVGY